MWILLLFDLFVAVRAVQRALLLTVRCDGDVLLLQVIIDLGRRPEARFLGVSGGEYLREGQVSWPLAESASESGPWQSPSTNNAPLVPWYEN